MRVKHLFIPMLAAMALVGCSSDEELNSSTDPVAVKGETGYVAVNIVQPKSVGKRVSTGDFENGSEKENNAREGLFFILDNDGNVQTIDGKSAQRITLSGTGTKETPAVERIYSAILLIDGVTEEPTSAKQIVCILNAPEGLENEVKTLSVLQEKVEDYCTGHITDGTFVMSNSVYQSNDNIIIGTPVEAENIKTSAADALANPVDIYVERVVAKVRAAEKEGGMKVNDVVLDVDGTEKTYKINIDGIALSNLTDKAYLLKDINNYSNSDWTWNDTQNFRCFWEVMPEKDVNVNQVSWNEIDKDTHYNADAQAGTTCFEQYILPNTFLEKNTAIIIAAHLTEGEGENEKNADLVWIRGGYTTDKGALNVVATAISTKFSYYKQTDGNTYKTLEPDDFEWKGETDGYGCYAQLKEDVKTVYTFNDNAPKEVENGVSDVNSYLSEKSNNLHARKYTDGKNYYFVNIEHVAASDGKAAIPGIVRNHIYDLTLNSVSGPGIPVFNPDDKNIPQEPVDETLYYLGARVNVLDWRIVTQGVDFGSQTE